MDTNYFMGSMGSVVGEKITRSFRTARDNKLPIIIFSASGGARMQEGTYSLFQMSKIMSEINNFQKDGLLYISVLTDPTTGGVAASFSMIADIIIAEPNSLIGFAGPRVIEQTTKSKLPDDFQSSLNVFHRGMVDMVVERNQLPTLLNKLLSIHNN
jgi:acetyl-CoA carboxylase carboxyl transferase subunit beta